MIPPAASFRRLVMDANVLIDYCEAALYHTENRGRLHPEDSGVMVPRPRRMEAPKRIREALRVVRERVSIAGIVVTHTNRA